MIFTTAEGIFFIDYRDQISAKEHGLTAEDNMLTLGSKQRPIIVKVSSEKMMEKVAEICDKNGFHFIAGLEQVDDLTDLKKALKEKTAPHNVYDTCPCGSGAKYKFCCMKKEITLNL